MLLLHLRQELGQHRHHHGLADQALEDIEVITVIAISLIVIGSSGLADQALEDRALMKGPRATRRKVRARATSASRDVTVHSRVCCS